VSQETTIGYMTLLYAVNNAQDKLACIIEIASEEEESAEPDSDLAEEHEVMA